ncbi:MAG TPA: 3'-5' exonuclease [Flavobacteriales bacterium]
MLNKLDPREILFLDIETVPQAAHFDQLPPEDQELWSEKARFIMAQQELSAEESYEHAGKFAEFGKIICISVGYFIAHSKEYNLRITSFYGHDESKILSDFAELLRAYSPHPFKLLCAHNGKEFDFPYICRRMLVNGIALPDLLDTAGKKPWEVQHLDTLELWKFGDRKHYTSLKLLARIFGIPTPKDDIDGSMVRSVYYEQQDLERIMSYCQKDVVTIAQLFLRYRGEELLKPEQVITVKNFKF